LRVNWFKYKKVELGQNIHELSQNSFLIPLSSIKACTLFIHLCSEQDPLDVCRAVANPSPTRRVVYEHKYKTNRVFVHAPAYDYYHKACVVPRLDVVCGDDEEEEDL
jgi:hypothetical protein